MLTYPQIRKPLQPKNIIHYNPPQSTIKPSKPEKLTPFTSSNKENALVFVLPIDVSLAEELSAVRQKLERLRLDREKTEKMLTERTRALDFQMTEMEERGEFQKEFEIEVDRLFRLKELKLGCLRKSPIRSLRDREMEKKKNTDEQSEGVEVGESKQELADESNTIGSPTSSLESSTASTSNSTLISSMKSPIPFGLSLESTYDK